MECSLFPRHQKSPKPSSIFPYMFFGRMKRRTLRFQHFRILCSVKAALWGASSWVVLFVAWFIFAASLNPQEWVAGLSAAAAGVIAFQVSNRAEPLCFNPPFKAVLQAFRLPTLIIRGTLVLIAELVRRMKRKQKRSAFRLAPFHATAADCRSAARRALAITFGTLPPNSLIIGIDRDPGLILFHQLRKQPLPQITRRVESA